MQESCFPGAEINGDVSTDFRKRGWTSSSSHFLPDFFFQLLYSPVHLNQVEVEHSRKKAGKVFFFIFLQQENF